jgi:hypothetical protein
MQSASSAKISWQESLSQSSLALSSMVVVISSILSLGAV